MLGTELWSLYSTSKQFPSWTTTNPSPAFVYSLPSGGIFWLLSLVHQELSFQADFSWKPPLTPGTGFHVSIYQNCHLKLLFRVRGDQHFLTPRNVCMGPCWGLMFKFRFSRSGAEPGTRFLPSFQVLEMSTMSLTYSGGSNGCDLSEW